MKGTPPGGRVRGFSLLEVLVTVTIFALLFAVLMAGWFQALIAQQRLDEAAKRLQQQQQVVFALRQLLAETMSPRKDRGVLFSGARRTIVTESSASLAPGLGAAPLPVSLQIQGNSPDSRLRIEHPGQPAVVLPWRLLVAEFQYLDAAGRVHDEWPPVYSMIDRPGGEVPALPALLQFTVQFEGQPRPMTLFVAPRSSPWHLSEPTSPFDTKPN